MDYKKPIIRTTWSLGNYGIVRERTGKQESSSMAPLLLAGLALGALGLGYKLTHPAPRFVGDLAKPGPIASADQVEVLIGDLLKSNGSISIGNGPGQIPNGTNSVLVSVLGANKDVLQGPIIAFGTVPLPAPLGSVVVNRADVKAVVRQGKIARDAKGNFAGDRHRRFAG